MRIISLRIQWLPPSGKQEDGTGESHITQKLSVRSGFGHGWWVYGCLSYQHREEDKHGPAMILCHEPSSTSSPIQGPDVFRNKNKT